MGFGIAIEPDVATRAAGTRSSIPSANVTPRAHRASTSFLPAIRGDFIVARRLDFGFGERQIARHLVAKQHPNFLEKLAKRFSRNLLVADQRELVCTSG